MKSTFKTVEEMGTEKMTYDQWLSHWDNEKENRQDRFIEIIKAKLPDYLFSPSDINWLKVVSAYWSGLESNFHLGRPFSYATLNFGSSLHVDPFEIAIDAGIVDKNGHAIME